MKVSTTLKSIFRRTKNNDRVYIYEYDEESGRQHRSTFHKFFSAIGIARKAKRQKYDPLKFSDSSPSPSSPDNSPSSPSPPPNVQTITPTNVYDDIDLEDRLELMTLGDDLPPNPLYGEPWDPLAIVIAWEYPEEEMPVFLDFHYLGYVY